MYTHPTTFTVHDNDDTLTEQVAQGDAEFLFAVDIAGRGWLITSDQDGEPFAASYATEGPDGEPDPGDRTTRRLGLLDYPITTVTFGEAR